MNNTPIKLTAGQYLELARKAPKNDTHEIEMVYLHKAIEVDPDCYEAHHRLAICFFDIGDYLLYEIECIKAFVTPQCGDIHGVDMAIEMANLSLRRNDIRAAEYYANLFGESLNIKIDEDGEPIFDDDDFVEEEKEDSKKFKVIPSKNSYINGLEKIKKLDKLVKNHDIQGAMDVIDEVNIDSPDIKCTVVLGLAYAHIAEQDYDGAVAICQRYKMFADTLIPLMQAYYLMDKHDEAREVLMEIVNHWPQMIGKYEVLKMALNLNEHELICKLAKAKLETRPYAEIRMMYAKALWNTGKKEEARRHFGIIKNEYGPYYIDFYFKDELENDGILPYDRIGVTNLFPEKNLYTVQDDYIQIINDAKADLDKEFEKNPDLMRKIKFLIMFGPDEFGDRLAHKLFEIDEDSKAKFEIIDFALLYGSYPYAICMKFLEDKILHKRDLRQYMNSNGRIVEILFKLNEDKFFSFPLVLIRAVVCAIGDIIYGSDDKIFERLETLYKLLDELVIIKENGKTEWAREELKYLDKARSMVAMIACLVAKTNSIVDEIKEEEAIYDQLKHINVSINLIDKYFKIMFPKKVVLKPIRPGDKK